MDQDPYWIAKFNAVLDAREADRKLNEAKREAEHSRMAKAG